MALRIAALALLLSAASLSAASPCPDLPVPTVGVLLRFDRPPQRGFVNELRLTVEQIFQPAGLAFRWAVAPPEKEVCGHRTVLIDLHGFCGPALLRDAGDLEPLRELPLGWTFVVGGEVMPNSMVDCDRITRATLQIGLARSHREWRNLLYVRLAGQVMAHELMHALLRISDHDGADLTRSPLRLDDLRPLPRLTPGQITALRQIGPRARRSRRGAGSAAPPLVSAVKTVCKDGLDRSVPGRYPCRL
jgi:hypothetical protein